MIREGMFIADRYEILEKIGAGGMSDVYKAMDHKLNRNIAIKVLKQEFIADKGFVSKFRAEAQAAAGLSHHNIVNVYDVGEENDIYYIVMELVEGITLKRYIERKGRLGIKEAVSIAIQIAQGIEMAHKHHVVHRDIKPQNIIISKEGKVKVTDFGIARAASANTINSSVMGSVHYVSPEQVKGKYTDERSDVYSFGISLFEMLTGRVPFEGETTVAVALQHIQNDMPSPKTYVDEVPVSVEKIVLKCTQKRPERRYQSMTDVIADLKRSLITPDEDFVIISPGVVANGPTKLISEDEVEQIKQASQRGIQIPNFIDKDKAVIKTEEETEEEYPEENTEDEEDDGLDESYDEEEDEDEDEEGDENETRKIDKVVTILGIALGVIILVITVIVIIKLTTTISGGSKSSSSKNSSIASEEDTTADDGLIEVPNVIGSTYDEAKEKLNSASLGIKKIEDYSSLYPEGQIFKQSIDAGKRVDQYTTIIVYISKGSEKFDLPDVVGNTQTEAETTLKAKNLDVTYDYEETNDSSLQGTVARTEPSAGTTVSSGDTVKIILYKASSVKTNEVPDLKGKTREEAIAALEALGFVGEVQYSETEDADEVDKVISQSGATIGSQAPADGSTIVTIIVGKEKETEPETTTIATCTVPDLKGQSEADAIATLKKLGLLYSVQYSEITDASLVGKVINQSGADVGSSVAADNSVTIGIVVGTEKQTEPPTTEPETTVAYNKFTGSIPMSSVNLTLANSLQNGGYDESQITSITVSIYVVDSTNNSFTQSVGNFSNGLSGFGDAIDLAQYITDKTGIPTGTGKAAVILSYTLNDGTSVGPISSEAVAITIE